ncbi:helix-turn-helix protein [Alicyclobacillus sacchari]|uniref:Helix-turn-helix protein n=1 Tax=Alicyclobacillus sacchari TaxID=392010 RepID=A0A4R8LQ76_9BACL|nr:AraC family transcriptional regulator [Alicyclobacillus sacchari]TDY49683.1 helix-turn-helix protein [Alicyclobacillus sacchari]
MSLSVQKNIMGQPVFHAFVEQGPAWPMTSWDVLQQKPIEVNFMEVGKLLERVHERKELLLCTIRSSQVVPIYPFLTQMQAGGFECVHVLTCDANTYIITFAAFSPERAMGSFEAGIARLASERSLVGVSRTFVDTDVRRWWTAVLEATSACHLNIYQDDAFSRLDRELVAISDEDRMRYLSRIITALDDRGYEGASTVIDQVFNQIVERSYRIEDVAELSAQVLLAAIGLKAGSGRDRLMQLPLSTRQWLQYVGKQCPKWWDWRERLKQCLMVIMGREEAVTSAHSAQIGQVIQVIESNYDSDLDVASLAARVFLSPSYLSKRFKSETGMTIREFIVQTRLNKAKDMLLHDFHLKAYEVGAHVGYPDPTYFNKLFKRQVGLTPKAFRDRAVRQSLGIHDPD